MKKPSQNISRSLREQKVGGRGEEELEVAQQRPGPSMVVPGSGRVEAAPGRMHERSAGRYAYVMKKYGGG